MKSEMKNNLNGMFWEPAGLNFNIPHAGNTKNALYIFQKNIVPITWNCMTTLERNPTTLPQTETILKGQSVSGISIDQLMQVKNYGDGAKKLVELLSKGAFVLNEKTASVLHKYVGKEDALTWGKFRDSDIAIGGVEYTPPSYKNLPQMAERGFSFISNRVEAKESAIATFLFMSRSQFFHDANKRTSSLMMNGLLIKHGYYPITVMNRDSEEFHTKLSNFYNSGDATYMMKFFEMTVEKNYQSKSNVRDSGKTKTDFER